ncbi:MAG: hypothetical protein RIS03_174 [Pseudomonadota bacterium]|jgi:hypothetical protein
MKKILAGLLMSVASTMAMADVGFFAGITYAIGAKDGLGFTVKALSSRREHNPVYGAGFTFYPAASPENQYGVDLSAGYQHEDNAVLIGYDFLRNAPQISLGVTDTKHE